MSTEKAPQAPSAAGKVFVIVFVLSTVAIALTIVSLRITTKPKVDAVLAASSARAAASASAMAPPANSANAPR